MSVGNKSPGDVLLGVIAIELPAFHFPLQIIVHVEHLGQVDDAVDDLDAQIRLSDEVRPNAQSQMLVALCVHCIDALLVIANIETLVYRGEATGKVATGTCWAIGSLMSLRAIPQGYVTSKLQCA